MDPWLGYSGVLASIVLSFLIRVPFAKRAEAVKVSRSYRGWLEVALISMVMIGYLVLPIVAIATSLFSFADYSLHPAALAGGVLCEVVGLWLCHRSHSDLGNNWSVTLELKESHRLVTQGVYQRIRHPMYTGLLLTAAGQALLLPNWFAGPSYLVAFGLLFALRVGREERMMHEQFTHEYQEYSRRTKRLIPGVY